MLGVLEDKNWETVCRTLAPLFSRIVTVPVNSARAAKPEALADLCRTAVSPKVPVGVSPSVAEALADTRRDEVVVCTGSLYLIGEVMELLGLGHAAHERALNEWSFARAGR